MQYNMPPANRLNSIKTQNLKIIENGNGTIIFHDKEITFGLNDLTFKIELAKNPEDPKPSFILSGEGKNAILKLYNFDNVLGTSTSEPIKFALNTQTKIAMYINIAIYQIASTHILHYSILEGEDPHV